MRTFRWLSANGIPPAYDLQRCGWKLIEAGEEPAGVGLAHAGYLDPTRWLMLLNPPPPWHRCAIMLAGVADPDERARLIRMGFGEVLGEVTTLAELEARALRVAEQSGWLPARRSVGKLTLDLLARDCFVATRAIGLHPREFALLWRLAENPGQPVSKRALLADVWRLGFVPETNSLAVHVFRLRAKLEQVGLADMVVTDRDDGYALVTDAPQAPAQPQWEEGDIAAVPEDAEGE